MVAKYDRNYWQLWATLCALPDIIGHARPRTAEVSANVGTIMTSHGPAPYSGDILDNPDLVWMDDVWTAEEARFSKRLELRS